MSENMPRRPARRGPHGPSIAEKPKDFKKASLRLLGFLKPFLAAVVVALLFAVGGTVLNLVGPNIIGDLTAAIQNAFSFDPSLGDYVVQAIDGEEVFRLCILLVVIYGAGLLCSYVQGLLMATVTQKNARNLRTAISEKINRLMFVTNWIMALTAIAASLIGFTLMFLIMGRSQKYFARQQRFLGEIDGHIEEVYAGHNVVKAYNAERKVKDTFNAINYKLYNSAWKSQFLSGLMMPLMTFIGNLGYVAVCVVGAALLVSGNIANFGVITAFTLYVRLFTSPLSQLAQAFTSMQTAAAASERVFEFLGEEEMADESGKMRYLAPDTVAGDVCFEHVRFGYEPGKIIIHDFSAAARAGQKIAIVGPTGAGKTTMVNLLMRFYELDGGCIRIDGIPTSELTRANVHELFCMVLQDTWLFEGTVRENIVYSKQGVTDEEVVRACKAVGLHHFITTLPRGYDTLLDDKANLSPGRSSSSPSPAP